MPSRPSRPQRLRVWRGELKKTSGGLRKQDLMKNKRGKIVSRRKSEAAKKSKDKKKHHKHKKKKRKHKHKHK